MVVPEPAAGAREGRVDAPGRGEGEGGVASEISREKFLGMGDAGSGPSWSGGGRTRRGSEPRWRIQGRTRGPRGSSRREYP